jgi:SAM-dependent methyltransferase
MALRPERSPADDGAAGSPGVTTEPGATSAAGTPSTPDDSSGVIYDQAYYDSYGAKDESGAHIVRPYRRGTNWDRFFAHIADCIVDRLKPRSALDVGCAIGLLVEALRERGVDARGIDVSEWAISQVPEELQPFCRVGSLLEEIDGRFDLITCIEVIEHLPAHEAPAVVANICRHTDTVLFSSSPTDFEEPTHMNVQPPDYWVALFAERGFFRDLRHDASYLVPHAFVLRRQAWGLRELAEQYDRAWWQLQQTLLGVQATRDGLAAQLEATGRALAAAEPDLQEAREARRRADSELLEMQKRYDRLVDDLAASDGVVVNESGAGGDGDAADEAEDRPWWLNPQTFVALQASRDRFAREHDEAWRVVESARSELFASEDERARTEEELAALQGQLHEVQIQIEAERNATAALEQQARELDMLRRTKLFRYTARLREVYGRLRR